MAVVRLGPDGLFGDEEDAALLLDRCRHRADDEAFVRIGGFAAKAKIHMRNAQSQLPLFAKEAEGIEHGHGIQSAADSEHEMAAGSQQAVQADELLHAQQEAFSDDVWLLLSSHR